MPLRLKREVNNKNEIININTVKKYLLISSKSKFIFVNKSLFINIFFGLLNDNIWFKEYLNNEYILINLRPELVEKKEPPIITKIKKIKFKFVLSLSKENPIFEILVEIDKKLSEKSVLKLKKRKKIDITTKK